jgi:pyruvate/2-oxoglutarate dehydrogenase complex dihydrolipoamide dehydrogenase (E3) component
VVADRCLRAAGITVVAGLDRVERIEPTGERLTVHYRRGGLDRSPSFDAVIGAVGWAGNIESLGLEAAGVATDRGSVAVDDALRTSAGHIFAAGDVTGRMMLVQSASFQAARRRDRPVRRRAAFAPRRGAPRRLH